MWRSNKALSSSTESFCLDGCVSELQFRFGTTCQTKNSKKRKEKKKNLNADEVIYRTGSFSTLPLFISRG